MNIDAVITQLRTGAPLFRGNCAGAAAYANGIADQVWLPLPSAYVVPGDESAGANESMAGLVQVVTERISVFVVLDNSTDAADRRGQAAAAQFHPVRAALFGALLNWRPDWNPTDPTANREARGLAYEGGELVDFDRARLFYRYNFALDVTVSDADGWQPPSTPLTEVQGTVTDAVSGETLITTDIQF